MREYLKSRMWSSENNQMDIVDPETGEVLSWEVTKETKGERKPPLIVALCAVLDTAIAEKSPLNGTVGSRVGGREWACRVI